MFEACGECFKATALTLISPKIQALDIFCKRRWNQIKPLASCLGTLTLVDIYIYTHIHALKPCARLKVFDQGNGHLHAANRRMKHKEAEHGPLPDKVLLHFHKPLVFRIDGTHLFMEVETLHFLIQTICKGSMTWCHS